MTIQSSRRSFLGFCGAAALAGAIPLQAFAETKLEPSDSTAQALGFVLSAASTKDPAYKPGSHCGNCQLYGTAQAKMGFAPCGAFGGKLVPDAGWCKAYTAKTA